MNTIKFILSFIWMFFYRKSPYYLINTIRYTDLKYNNYFLYRTDYIFYFIPIVVPLDYCTSIGNKHFNIISKWHSLYGRYYNGKYSITEREYTK